MLLGLIGATILVPACNPAASQVETSEAGEKWCSLILLLRR